MGESYAGGIVSLNAVRAADAYGLTYYIGIVRDSLCGGAVNALSARLDACAGGIVARNNQGRVYSCGQTEAVSASTGGAKAYELIGGIVGYNYGIVDKCFFIGSLAEYEERTCVGGVCGLNRIAYNFRVNLGENYFSSGDHTCGAILFDVNNDYYRSIEAQKIYSLSALELDAENAQYIETFLDPGGTAATVEEIKAMEGIYYE